MTAAMAAMAAQLDSVANSGAELQNGLVALDPSTATSLNLIAVLSAASG